MADSGRFLPFGVTPNHMQVGFDRAKQLVVEIGDTIDLDLGFAKIGETGLSSGAFITGANLAKRPKEEKPSGAPKKDEGEEKQEPEDG